MSDSRAPFAAAKRPGEARRAERGGGRARERGHVVGRRMRRTTREVVRVSMWTRPRDGKGDGGYYRVSTRVRGLSGSQSPLPPKIFSANQIKRTGRLVAVQVVYKSSRLGRVFRRITHFFRLGAFSHLASGKRHASEKDARASNAARALLALLR